MPKPQKPIAVGLSISLVPILFKILENMLKKLFDIMKLVLEICERMTLELLANNLNLKLNFQSVRGY